ncbi:transposable element Tc3 transposase [Trichonephila clavipes]|nr:transposable element Tc3 transposase [Trichonephila clavipes]
MHVVISWAMNRRIGGCPSGAIAYHTRSNNLRVRLARCREDVSLQYAVTSASQSMATKGILQGGYEKWLPALLPKVIRTLAEVYRRPRCALWAGGIIGPYFFKNDEGHNVTVNGDRYRAMITNFFIPELNNHDVQELWFQQDGATCHTARATIDLLKDTFGDRLISRFGPVNWPPRSCDLTSLDYFLWGYVKSLVYADKPQTLDYLEDNIRRVIADIRPQMLENVIENWTSRLDYIRASRGSLMPEIIFKTNKRTTGGRPRNFEPRSSDEDDTKTGTVSPNYPTAPTVTPGLEPATLQPRVRDHSPGYDGRVHCSVESAGITYPTM